MVKFACSNLACSDCAQENLCWACSHDDIWTVRYMVEQLGVNVNKANRRGETPLYRATVSDSLEVVEYLLTHHADPNIEAGRNLTPLWIATLLGLVEVTKRLLDNGANVHGGIICRAFGTIPLQIAERYNRTLIVELLLERGANMEARSGRIRIERQG